MSASQASTETRIPRQVQARVAASVARYTPAEPDQSSAAPADPAATPAAPAAPSAEVHLDPRHSDPAYWKARFDVTSGMLAKERADHRITRDEKDRQIAELQDKARQVSTAAAPAPAASATVGPVPVTVLVEVELAGGVPDPT